MTTMTAHPDIDPDRGDRAGGSSRGSARWQKLVAILGLVVVLWVGDSLYEVISRGAGSGDDDRRTGGTQTTQPTDGGEPTPGGTGEHDPSQFDHG